MRHVAAALLAFAFYLATLASGLWAHDSAELTAAAWVLGIAHPAGSPLYCQLLNLFASLLPIGSIAWRANAFSAVAGAVAVGLTSRLLSEEGLPRGVDSGLALLFGFSLTFWSQCVVAEVYAANVALLALSFLLALRHQRSGEARFIVLAALAWGLLVSNYAVYAALTLPVSLALLASRRRPRLSLGVLARASLALFLGVSLYAYVPARVIADPPVVWGHLRTPQDVADHLRSASTQERAFSLTLAEYAERLGRYARFSWRDLGVAALPLILLGARGVACRSTLALLSLGLLGFDALFVVFLDAAHLESEAYGIPGTWAIVLMGASGGASWARRWPKSGAFAVIASALLLSVVHHDVSDRHDTMMVEDEARQLLAALPVRAALFTHEDSTTFPLLYLSTVEGLRPDVEIYDHWGNLFSTAYPEPLHRVPESRRLSAISAHESRRAREILSTGRSVILADPFIEYEPEGYALRVVSGIGVASLPGTDAPAGIWGAPMELPLRIGHRGESDWMVRQLVASKRLRQAETARRAGDEPRALSLLREAAARADFWELHLWLSQRLLSLGDPELALDQARRAVFARRARPAGYALLTRAAMALGRDDEALAAAQTAQDLPGAPAEVFSRAGALLTGAGRLGEARGSLKRALELEPKEPRHHLNMAILEKRAGACEEARALLRRALDLSAGEPEVASMAVRQMSDLASCVPSR